MKCQSCNYENDRNDKFCGQCGVILMDASQSSLDYEEEIRRFAKEQEDAKKLEPMDDLDLDNPIGLLKAQLKLLISIYRRLERLENNNKQQVRIIDFDMPFWSLVGFEIKLIFVGMFIMSVLFCAFYALLSPFIKSILLTLGL